MVDIDTMEAGREMDALVAELVIGQTRPIYTHSPHFEPIISGAWLCHPDYYHGDVCEWNPLAFSADIAAAWMVVEKLRRTNDGDWLWRITDVVGYWVAVLMDEHGQAVARSGFCDTAPLAICRAALKATEAANGTE